MQFSRLAQPLFRSHLSPKILFTMNNTLDNYQPDNRVFWQLLMAVLCLVFCLFYTTYQLRHHGDLSWYDLAILGILALPVTSVVRKMIMQRR